MSISDANFFYNSMLAKSLVQLIPSHEKGPIRAWFNKLNELVNTPKEIEKRDEFMWFILMMLQCQKIREPFNKPPPADLELLRETVSPKVYEEILVANGDNMQLLDKPGFDETTAENETNKFRTTAPSQFFYNQPLPQEGILCYIAAFSDQGYP